MLPNADNLVSEFQVRVPFRELPPNYSLQIRPIRFGSKQDDDAQYRQTMTIIQKDIITQNT
jgi:hypothetical protein